MPRPVISQHTFACPPPLSYTPSPTMGRRARIDASPHCSNSKSYALNRAQPGSQAQSRLFLKHTSVLLLRVTGRSCSAKHFSVRLIKYSLERPNSHIPPKRECSHLLIFSIKYAICYNIMVVTNPPPSAPRPTPAVGRANRANSEGGGGLWEVQALYAR